MVELMRWDGNTEMKENSKRVKLSEEDRNEGDGDEKITLLYLSLPLWNH